MEEFKNILDEIVRDYGLKILEDPQKFKAVFSDYAKGEYGSEKDLFSKIIETGAAKEIKDTEDFLTTKKALVKKLHDKYFFDEIFLDNYLYVFIQLLRSDYTINNKASVKEETQEEKSTTKEPTAKKPAAKKSSEIELTEEINNKYFCINCGAIFLSNDSQFCSSCGYPRYKIPAKRPAAMKKSAKKPAVKKTNMKDTTVELENDSIKERHGLTKFILYLGIILNGIIGLIYIFISDTLADMLYMPSHIIILNGIIMLSEAVFLTMILNWKKMGWWLLVVAVILNLIITYIGFQDGAAMRPSVIYSILGLSMYYGILRIKKNGKSIWEQLE